MNSDRVRVCVEFVVRETKSTHVERRALDGALAVVGAWAALCALIAARAAAGATAGGIACAMSAATGDAEARASEAELDEGSEAGGRGRQAQERRASPCMTALLTLSESLVRLQNRGPSQSSP
jgi:hypothetical protein